MISDKNNNASKQNSLNLYSVNTRGLGDKTKRRSIFHWLNKNHKGITFLQETHSTLISEKLWKHEYQGEMYFSHGTCGSRGVAILIPDYLNATINNKITDMTGRFILLDIKIDDQDFVLVNIYAPTKDKQIEQIELINLIKNHLIEFIDCNIILGGDFNACLNPEVDKHGGSKEDVSEYAKEIIELNQEFNLIDVWRVMNPTEKRFTWRGNTKKGRVFSRLDFWLISTHMIYDLVNTDILPSIKTDHSLISLSFEIKNSISKGKGFWKFNGELLKDAEYVATIKNILNECKNMHKDFTNKAMLWDYVKCEIRGATISYSAYAAKRRREQGQFLSRQLKFLEEKIDSGNDSLIEEYMLVKNEIENINELQTNGVLLRSKAKWIEDGEKCTKYFLQMENRNYKSKYIKSIINQNKTITDPQGILNAEKDFYSSLYTQKENTNCCKGNCTLLSSNKIKLLENEKQICEGALTLSECGQSLHDLPNKKSPGSDGFTTEFYKFFWLDICNFVHDSFNYSFNTGELSAEQRRAILTLLPKPNKDLRELKNWRPISLLNTDYKILTKLLANRLQKVIPKIVSEDQSGYIKQRYIGENIRTILDIIEFTNYKENPGLMLFLDFEKAFDTISWSFLMKTLAYFNFGENFIKWISVLYNKPLACVSNNGYATDFFQLSRGVRQGCPISALLFILVVEIMAINLKDNENIHGIDTGQNVHLITQLADDTTLFLKDVNSLKIVFNILDHFEKCTGLRLNKGKTEGILLGLNNNANLSQFGIKTVKHTIKSLGIIIDKDLDNMININFKEKISKLKNLLNMWKSRLLSIKGKITILRSQALPLIIYPSSVLYTPDHVIKEIELLFFDFIWPKKKHHIKKQVLIQSIEDGGLKMPDIKTMIKATKLMWIKRFLTKNNNYISIAHVNSKIDNFEKFFYNKLNVCHLNSKPTPFYNQILSYWEEFRDLSSDKKSKMDILNEKLWLNKDILVDNKPLMFPAWSENGINCLFDILENNGIFKTKDQIQNSYGIQVDTMQYNSLKSAISKTWLQKIKCQNQQDFKFEARVDGDIKIDKKFKNISKVSCKEFYWQIIYGNLIRPTAFYKWEELYYYVTFNWKHILKLPYMTASETSLQSLQYQIINRFFPCNSIIHVWYTDIKANCAVCNIEDTIEHYFFYCHIVSEFWEMFKLWWKTNTLCDIRFGAIDIVFGIMNENNIDLIGVLNFCLLFSKYYIHNCKLQNKPCIFNKFILKLRKRIEAERFLAFTNGKLEGFIKKWEILSNI